MYPPDYAILLHRQHWPPSCTCNAAGVFVTAISMMTFGFSWFVEDLLRTASHIPMWAIGHTENGFISGDELVDAVRRLRRVSAIYTKDFSDLLGVRASIITADGVRYHHAVAGDLGFILGKSCVLDLRN